MVLEKLDALSGAEASALAIAATDLTVAGIVKHLAYIEDRWFSMRFAGRPWPEPWASNPGDDWPFASAHLDTVDDLHALYLAACDRSRAVAASRDSLDARAASPSFGKEPVSLRWVFVHMIVETAQHLGHVELLHDAARAD